MATRPRSRIRAKKRFGQHFLHDQATIQRIVEALAPAPGQLLVEIGPGHGALTHPVLRAASHLVVLACGPEKAEILGKILTGEPDEVRYPIHALWPVLDRVTWLVDSEAAKSL